MNLLLILITAVLIPVGTCFLWWLHYLQNDKDDGILPFPFTLFVVALSSLCYEMVICVFIPFPYSMFYSILPLLICLAILGLTEIRHACV